MAKIYDVPADQLVLKLAETLKSEDIPAPEWAPFVKTGVHANKPPQKSDWWYTRCASLLRKIYVHGPMGICTEEENHMDTEWHTTRKQVDAIIRNA